MPQRVIRRQSHPISSNPETPIRFNLSQPGDVELAVHSVTGQKVATLVSGVHKAGTYSRLTVDRSPSRLSADPNHRLPMAEPLQSRRSPPVDASTRRWSSSTVRSNSS